PMWVHAMYNNVNGSAQPEQNLYDEFEQPNANRARTNTSLWRNLMADRNLFYISNETASGNIHIYRGSGKAYIVTRGESVYRMVDPSDAKFPMSIRFDGRDVEYRTNLPEFSRVSIHIPTRTEATSAEQWVGRYVLV